MQKQIEIRYSTSYIIIYTIYKKSTDNLKCLSFSENSL